MEDAEKKEARGRLKRAVANAAPAIAGALGGPLAGAAVERLSRAIFGSEDKDEGALEDALKTATPDQFAEILKADHEFAVALRQAAVEEERIAAGDRASARSRQQAMGDLTPAVLGALIIAGFFIVLAAMLGRTLPPGAETEFSIMLGALATMTAAVVNYFFGSSAGSKEKTKLMLRSAARVKD
jgi:hypothetical protein